MSHHYHEGCGAVHRSYAGWSAWSSLLGTGIVLMVFRLHAFALPLETDECNYAYIGARLLAGDRLYVDVWDHQPPGVFLLFAGVIALFDDGVMTFRWMACGFSLASMLLIFLILGRILDINSGSQHGGAALGHATHGRGSLIAAILGSVLFAIVSADPGSAGEGCQREIYMNTLILLAWYAAIRAMDGAEESRRLKPTAPVAGTPASVAAEAGARQEPRPPGLGWWLLAGASLGVASLFKTIVAVHWVCLVLWMLVYLSSPRAESANDNRQSTTPHPRALKLAAGSGLWAARWRVLALLALGPFVIWGSTLAYFAATGRGGDFIDAVFMFNLGYAGDAGLPARLVGFFTPDRHPFIFDSAMPLWIAGGLATLWLMYDGVVRRQWGALLILALVAAGYVAVCLPGRFWPHYYYLMIPPLVIAFSYSVVTLPRSFRIPLSAMSITRPVPFAIQAALGLAVAGSALWTQYRDYLSQPSFGITVKRYNSRDFWGRGQGENVQRVTEPDDTIFVYGNDASIYYYSGRRCASRYTMITGLAEDLPGAERRRAILMEELRRNKPRLILVLFDYEPFDEWLAFLHEHYTEPVGWDLHDKTRQPIMFVVARKDAPVEPIDWDWDRSEVGGWHLGER